MIPRWCKVVLAVQVPNIWGKNDCIMHKENTRTGLTLEKNGVTFESRLIRQNVVFA